MGDLEELSELVDALSAVARSRIGAGFLTEPRAPVGAEAPPTPDEAPVAAAEPPGPGSSPQQRMEAVRSELGDCTRCTLHKGRSSLVFGVGNPDADLVIVGEAPGFHEDKRGEPFVGAAGEMLDKMLVHVLGLPRPEVYILNVVKCRPPKNRNPLPEEIDACRPFLNAQLKNIGPKVILVLGTVAFKTLFQTSDGITRNRGVWKELDGVPTMPTFHPAYLLRNPADKRLVFADLKEARARYDEVGGRR
jgi:uracil-DNA glycosylase